MRALGYFTLVIVIGVFLMTSCNKKIAVPELSKQPLTQDDYVQSIQEHRAKREAQLRQPTGWLSLVGLYWLEEGMNSIGAAADNTIQLKGTDTETIGAYQKSGDEIFFGMVEGIEVLGSRGEPYMGGPVTQVTYPYEQVSHQSLYWHIMRRGEKYGLRVKDTLAETRMNFQGIDFFEPDQKYVFDALIEPTDDSITITNVLGLSTKTPVAAYLSFSVAEQYYSLAALDGGKNEYFVIFSDQSTAVETYGGGRFLYPAKPCDTCDQRTILDFNKAENPPCAYSDFATCPLPPTHNDLKIKVLAGERYVDNH
jgi:uncharacterized protein (DUF1684 family)